MSTTPTPATANPAPSTLEQQIAALVDGPIAGSEPQVNGSGTAVSAPVLVEAPTNVEAKTSVDVNEQITKLEADVAELKASLKAQQENEQKTVVNVDCGGNQVKTGDVETILKNAAQAETGPVAPEANANNVAPNVVVPATAVQSPTLVEAAKPQLAQGA